jgi:hypothetical protein
MTITMAMRNAAEGEGIMAGKGDFCLPHIPFP